MAGHSAWKNIKHKKAANDKRRGKMWSKCARAIIVAARNGGGDPTGNLALRYAIDEARAVNMPKDTIEKAVKKGTGELGAENYESAVYEGYGPHGVAIMLEILTDNRNRTSPEIKILFQDHGGNLGSPGSVAYIFQTRGEVLIPKTVATEEKVMDAVLDAGAQDVIDGGEFWQVLCEPSDLMGIRAALDKKSLKFESAGLTRVPDTTVTCTGEAAKQIVELVEALEDHDDIQKVHANFEIPNSEMAALEKVG